MADKLQLKLAPHKVQSLVPESFMTAFGGSHSNPQLCWGLLAGSRKPTRDEGRREDGLRPYLSTKPGQVHPNGGITSPLIWESLKCARSPLLELLDAHEQDNRAKRSMAED